MWSNRGAIEGGILSLSEGTKKLKRVNPLALLPGTSQLNNGRDECQFRTKTADEAETKFVEFFSQMSLKRWIKKGKRTINVGKIQLRYYV